MVDVNKKVYDKLLMQSEKIDEKLIKLITVALNDEYTATWQYFTALALVKTNGRNDVTSEYDEHMKEEMEHIMKIVDRMKELGVDINNDFNSIDENAHKWEKIDTFDAQSQLIILINAEHEAIEYYREVVTYAEKIGDYVTAELFKEIMADEVKHEYDLKTIYNDLKF